MISGVMRERMAKLAGFALLLLAFAFFVEVSHVAAEAEDHCDGGRSHCVLCHGTIGVTLAQTRLAAEPPADFSSEAVRSTPPAVCARGARLLPPGRAPPSA